MFYLVVSTLCLAKGFELWASLELRGRLLHKELAFKNLKITPEMIMMMDQGRQR